MIIQEAQDSQAWDKFLTTQKYRPFLQSWTMGEVYRDIGQEPIRLEARESDRILGICQALLVPARRGRHLSVPYGPLLKKPEALGPILEQLKTIACERNCAFIRMSPFWPESAGADCNRRLREMHAMPSPLHLLAEHLWYLPLKNADPWASGEKTSPTPISRPLPPVGEEGARITRVNEATPVEEKNKNNKHSLPPPGEGLGIGGPREEERTSLRSEDDIFKNMRSTARNLIRRAEKEGVTIIASEDPVRDLPEFLKLHDETRKRHGFTPYTNAFFRAQVARFAPRKECTLYLARYQNETIAASIHMHLGGETSYHHGASAEKYKKIPASYLLQWTTIRDAIKRGDHVYNFWGIAPTSHESSVLSPEQNTQDLRLKTQDSHLKSHNSRHPFAGVTLFKTGFGGNVLNLIHCFDIPFSPRYRVTRVIEQWRRWRRGF